MTDGSLGATFAVEYDDEEAVTPMAVSGDVDLEYSGIYMHARAYAIPAVLIVMQTGMTDLGNVRIKCHAEADLQVHGVPRLRRAGRDAALRRNWERRSMRTPLTVLDIRQISPRYWRKVIPAWEEREPGTGRLSCDVFSDEKVSVQVLVRNRSGQPADQQHLHRLSRRRGVAAGSFRRIAPRAILPSRLETTF